MLIKQMSGYNVRIGHPLGSLSCQDIEGVGETTAATSIGLIQAAIEDECMSCAVCDETFHTEVETIVETATVAEEPEVTVTAEETAAEPVAEETAATIAEDETTEEEETADVEEADEDDQEQKWEDEEPEEEEEEEEEEEDDDYDEELDDEPKKPKEEKKNGGLFQKIKFIWNKLGDDTDDIIKDLAK
jgi:flagellar biosynthesis GTPase FlhF